MNSSDFSLTSDVLTLANSADGSGSITFPGNIVIPASPPPYSTPGTYTIYQDFIVANSDIGSIPMCQFTLSGSGYNNPGSFYGTGGTVQREVTSYLGNIYIDIQFDVVQVSGNTYRITARAINWLDQPVTITPGTFTLNAKLKLFLAV